VTIIGFATDWNGSRTAVAVLPKLLRLPARLGAVQTSVSPPGSVAIGISARAEDGQRGGLDIGELSGLMAVLDGRLDNAQELHRALDLDRQSSPARLILGAYERWGDDCLGRLRGEYALIVWDGRRRRVLAARDPFGVRPLHYVASKDHLWIASDADQFLTAGLVEGAPDDTMAVEFLTRRFRTLDRSFFRDVRRIPPGHGLTATEADTRTFDYRVLPASNLSFASTEACYEAFREHFSTAVRRRIASDRPVVADLSGGCDSSSIVCVAARLLREDPGLAPDLIAASAAFPGLPCDEGIFVDAVARHSGVRVIKWDGTRASDLDPREPVLGGPAGRMVISGGTEGFVDIALGRGAGTLLSGMGGDLVGQPFGRTLDEIANGEWRAAARRAFPRGLPMNRAARRALHILEAFFPRPFGVVRSIVPRRFTAPDWLTSHAKRLAEPTRSSTGAEGSFASHGQRLRWRELRRADIALTVDIRQTHASRIGLEVRYPFLDWDLIAFTLGIPFEHWPPPGEFARLHRHALRADLPAEIYGRYSKAEFAPAVVNSVEAQLPTIHDVFHDGPWASERLVSQRRARELLLRFRNVSASRDLVSAYHLRAITSLETWLRAVLRYRTAV
jgi:asparagine synthase (glutamine-hydrolysing)